MSTQEERIAALEERILAQERTTRDHRSVLQAFTYELTAVKGLIQDVKDDVSASFKQLVAYQIQTEDQIEASFNQVEARLDKIEATMATNEDLAATENRILDAFHQLIAMINTR